MWKKTVVVLLTFTLLLSGCSFGKQKNEYQKYQFQFFNTFDTFIQVVGYSTSQEEFDGYAQKIQEKFEKLNALYDKFNSYDGIANIKTINDQAGIAPVKVDPSLLELLEFSKEWYQKTNGRVNIAMGSVLTIWQESIRRYHGNDAEATLPPLEQLQEAAKYTDIDKVIIDKESSTVFLAEKGMSLDVGAVAKGFAAQQVADEIYAEGFKSFLISAGGNVVAKEQPYDNVRNSWGVGIQDPKADPNDPNTESLDVVFIKNSSLVSSGDYQRYYMVGDRIVHHIIDGKTLYPSNYYRAVSVNCADSGIADIASTALYLMDFEEGKAFAQQNNLGVMWVFPDGTIEVNDILLPTLRDRGGATAAINE